MLESIGAASVDVAAALAEIKNLRVEVQPIPDPIHAVVEDTRFTYTGKEFEVFIRHASIVSAGGGVLRKAGKPSAVYIRQPSTLENPKVHLTWCKTLDEMKASGRYDRYKSADTIDSDHSGAGLFDIYRGYETKVMLDVCQLCRNNLRRAFGVQYQEVEKKYLVRTREDRHGLNVKGWFENVGLTLVESAITLLPNKSAALLDHRNYTDDWREVSRKMRESVRWRCSQCNVNLSSLQGLLQVHHVNHIRSDNRAENLKVLCLQCHSNQPAHEHMKNAPDYRENVMLIESVRRSRK
jgi:hypothetical protein